MSWLPLDSHGSDMRAAAVSSTASPFSARTVVAWPVAAATLLSWLPTSLRCKNAWRKWAWGAKPALLGLSVG